MDALMSRNGKLITQVCPSTLETQQFGVLCKLGYVYTSNAAQIARLAVTLLRKVAKDKNKASLKPLISEQLCTSCQKKHEPPPLLPHVATLPTMKFRYDKIMLFRDESVTMTRTVLVRFA